MKKKTIAIPRALLYYKYASRWRAFFESLGFQVITSPPTNAGILKQGLGHSYSDFCLPIKSMLGHIDSLRDRADYLFIPRYISVEPDAFMCPKFLGLPDVVKASFTRLPALISPNFNIKEGPGANRKGFCASVARTVCLKSKTVEEAFDSAFALSEDVHEMPLKDDGFNIAIIGRPYLVFDDHLNGGIIRTLNHLGANAHCREPHESEIKRTMSKLIKPVYWSMGRELVAMADSYFNDPRIDGIVHMINATCGPDAFTTEVIKGVRKGNNKPYMAITIDEHTSTVGIQTRLEAFIDMMGMAGARAGGR